MDFINKYLSINLKDYPNLGIDLEINRVLLLLFSALAIACVIINITEHIVVRMLKKLIRSESLGEQNAKTLTELGLMDSFATKYMLKRRGGDLRRTVKRVGERQISYEEAIEAVMADKKQRREGRLRILGLKKRTENSECVPAEELAEPDCCGIAPEEICPSIKDGGIDAEQNREQSAEDAGSFATDSKEANGSSSESGDAVTYRTLMRGDAVDFATARFYLPEDKVDYAEGYIKKKAPSVMKTVLSVALLLGFYVALALLMPSILSLVNNTIIPA